MTNLINEFLSQPLWLTIPLCIIYVASLTYFLYILWHYRRNSFSVVLTIVALAMSQTAMAESSWTVTNDSGNSNTFTIKRSEKGYAQTVHFRTISLSAYAGQHFTAVDMDYTFPADEDEKIVTVSELTPTGAYLYYMDGTIVKYGFEVTDRAGFRLDYAERKKTWGTSVPSSGAFSIKDITIQASEYLNTDDGYDNNVVKSVNSSSYFDIAAPKAYYQQVGAELRMTLSMDVKEADDGYQYMSILNSTTLYDNRKDCSNGDPGNISNSWYMAGFEHKTGGKDESYKSYSFPVTSVGNNAGHSNPWGHGTNYILSNQKFNTNRRASDGRLLLPMNFSVIAVRCNASGSDDDDWYAKNVKAHIQAVDGTAPTKSAVSVNPGRHAKGNTVYVSVAFSEIVTVTDTPTLSTTSDNHWGSLIYETGSGTNVLTFSTTIPQDATGSLNVTGLSGTVKDLAGNNLSGGVTATGLCTLDGDLVYAIEDFQAGSKANEYLITCHDDLHGLAGYVNAGNNCSGKTFRQVTDFSFPHATSWNNSSSTENNYTAIGNASTEFRGTYNGDGHTISGIRIYKGGNTNADGYQGLFGKVSNGTVKRVTLDDTHITGRDSSGGIAGSTSSATIEDCIVAADVCIHAVKSSTYSHGGIVGYNQVGTVRRCISRATLTVTNTSGCYGYGGIVGYNSSDGTISNCIADGVVIPDVNGRGAIVGYKYNGTLTRNYYYGCKVASNSVTPSGVGQGTSQSSTATNDADGTRALYAITLGTNVTLVRNGTNLPGTNNVIYDNGADINGQSYAYDGATVNLGYSGDNIGYHVDYSATAGSITGNTLTMPAEAVTVSATPIDVWGVETGKDGTTAEKAYTISDTRGLDLLATLVNGGNSFSNKFFQLGDNIEYNYTNNWNVVSEENNYTAIGTESNPFQGKFNGNDNTVRGIRIYKGGTSTSDNYQGLFGHVKYPGSVSRVNLSDARITAGSYVGGIAGYISNQNLGGRGIVESCTVNADVCIHTVANNACYHGGIAGYSLGQLTNCISHATLTVADGLTGCNGYGGIAGSFGNFLRNCLALGVTIPDVNGHGAIVGFNHSYAGFRYNYYYGCTVAGIANATNVGLGTDGSTATSDGEMVSAYALYAITLGTNVTLNRPLEATLPGTNNRTYTNGADINGQPYAYANAEVTLGYSGSVPDGCQVVYSTTAGTINGSTLRMPSEAVTVNATLVAPYIDADGNEQTCTNFTLIESSTKIYGAYANDEAWYAVSGEVHIGGQLEFKDKAVHLILCDGATLSVTKNNSDVLLCPNGSLTIYGQSAQSGSLTATTIGNSSGFGIRTYDGDITVNGGIISATSSNLSGIYAYGSGSVTINRGSVTATGSGYYGIFANNNVTINGGTVSATGASSGIYASNNITISCATAADRITASSYSKNPVVKSGQILTDDTNTYSGSVNLYSIAGKTLRPYGVTVAMNSLGVMTYASPFALDLSNVDAYVISDYDNGNSTLTLTKVDEAPANTGLLLKAKNDEQKNTTIALPLQENAAAVGTNLLVGVLSSETVVPQTDGPNTNFILANGKYGIDWYTLSADGAIGANKAYLQLPTAQISGAREFTWVYEGEATSVHSAQFIVHSEADAWYDLNGRKLSGKPTQKGIYINNGKKVVVK